MNSHNKNFTTRSDNNPFFTEPNMLRRVDHYYYITRFTLCNNKGVYGFVQYSFDHDNWSQPKADNMIGQIININHSLSAELKQKVSSNTAL